MAFVEMKAPHVVVAERPEHPNAADAQHGFLAEPVVIVAAVEGIGEPPCLGVVLGEIGVEQQHGDDVAVEALDVVAPGTDHDAPAVDVNLAAGVEFREPSLGRPAHRVGVLTTVRVESLSEVALPVDERDADHSQAEVGGTTQQIAGEDAQSTRVRRDVALEGDLHRKVGDVRVVPRLPHHVVHGHEACATHWPIRRATAKDREVTGFDRAPAVVRGAGAPL